MLRRRLKLIVSTKLLQGIWAGMIGGTAVQTLILAIMTVRCDWEKEVSHCHTHTHTLARQKHIAGEIVGAEIINEMFSDCDLSRANDLEAVWFAGHDREHAHG